MRVAWIGGAFPADSSHLTALQKRLDFLSVYGATFALSHYSYDPRPPAGIPHRVFRPRGVLSRGHGLWIYPGLHAALSEDHPDVVHVVSEPWGFLAVQAARWAKRFPKVAFVLHGCDRIWWHGSPVEQIVRRHLARRTLWRADAFLAESQEAISRANEVGLAEDAVRAAVHTNPRDPNVFRPPDDAGERLAARQQFQLPADGIGIAFLGRLVPEKGPITFLDAIERMNTRPNPPAWAVMAGAGPLEAEVRRRCAALNVRFLGQLRSPHETAPFLRAIDVLAVPSHTTPSSADQSPRVVIEAMMSGVAVVGSTCGAIPEMVGQAGVIVPEKRPPALAAGLAEAISRARDEKFRAAARRHAVRRYSDQGVADLLTEAWDRARGARLEGPWGSGVRADTQSAVARSQDEGTTE